VQARLPAPDTRIDELVFGLLRERGIQPAEPCSDEVFVRRVFIDVIGTLPRPGEITEFLDSKDPEKRRRLIARLLQRPEFTDFWALKWSDLLRVKAEFPINLWPNASQAYHRWLREAVASNMPLDRFARELLVSNGSNFRSGPVNFYRALQRRDASGIAQVVALAFLGERTEKWPAEKLAGFSVFFSQLGYKSTAEWKEEIVYFDAGKAPAAGVEGLLPDGTRVKIPAGSDPRAAFADWLLKPGNPAFSRAMANRLWSWLLGCGVVHEPDDLRADNPPSNPALLAFLGTALEQSGYDMQRFFTLVLESRCYQLSSVQRSQDPQAAALFACYPLRRLDAEVLIDAICQVTGTTEQYISAIPEPFTYSPQNLRSIALPDGSISSPFLELFGRPPRDTGLESERNNSFSAMQRLHLLNSTHVRQKLENGPRIQEYMTKAQNEAGIVRFIYLSVLSRRPTEAELASLHSHFESSRLKPRERVAELLWVLVNSNEFLHRH
jgi:hypothetical protein